MPHASERISRPHGESEPEIFRVTSKDGRYGIYRRGTELQFDSSRDNRLNHFPRHVCQTEVSAVKAIRELFVIKAHEVQNRGM